MSLQKLLTDVVVALERSSCPYMLSGSFASSMQGEPRLTHGIDLVVALTESGIDPLVSSFRPPRYHLDVESVRSAVRTRTMFNLLELTEGDKVDFWLLTDEPFDVSRFSRRRRVKTLDIDLFVSSPEDTIFGEIEVVKALGRKRKAVFGRATCLRGAGRTSRPGLLDRMGEKNRG
jgi:hypothetical protein